LKNCPHRRTLIRQPNSHKIADPGAGRTQHTIAGQIIFAAFLSVGGFLFQSPVGSFAAAGIGLVVGSSREVNFEDGSSALTALDGLRSDNARTPVIEPTSMEDVIGQFTGIL